MEPARTVLRTAALLVALAAPALASHWITPDWPQGREPRFEPVPWLWLAEVRECPIMYRAVVEVPEGCDRATVLLRTSGYVYVYVDGQQVYEWAPQPRTRDREGVPADPDRVHEVDLTEALTGLPPLQVGGGASGGKPEQPPVFREPPRQGRPGAKHVIAVSAPAKGLVLDGGLYAGTKRLADLATGAAWTVTKFPPTTILDDQAVMRLDDRGDAAPVKAGEEWKADEDALAAACAAALVARARRRLEDLRWELDLLTHKGIYLDGGEACAWGGPWRLAPEAHRVAGLLRQRAAAIDAATGRLAGADVRSAAALQKAAADVQAVQDGVLFLRWNGSSAAQKAYPADHEKAMKLAWPVIAGPNAAPPDAVTEQDRALAGRLGHALNRLNESRYDRLGWINLPGLTDSDVSKWGIRINPVTGPTRVTAPRKWLFSTDPQDKGLTELRHTIGYNIETQWPTLDMGKPWNSDGRFKDYAGVAWYRVRLHVPGEWAGSDVVLTVPVGGKERLWVNDTEVTERGMGEGRRTYRIPPAAVAYGGENVLALRIEAGADARQRGLIGAVEASCPSLEGDAAKQTPQVDVRATPLSPCVVLTPQTDTLAIHHAGRSRLFVPGSGRPLIERTPDAGKAGGLGLGNWALLWPGPGATAGQRPILLVLEPKTAEITCDAGVTTLKLPKPGQRVIAVRPWVKQAPPSIADDDGRMKIAEAARFWSQAALAVPVNYMEVTRVAKPGEPYDDLSIDKVPAGPVLHHTVIYDYLETRDAWGTEPLRVAPLPALCSLAIDTKFRGLRIDQQEKVEVLQDGGRLAPYRGVRGADRVSYAYPVEPFPRLAGFTSWMFAGGDAGVTGNRREVEAMASTGANSFRPQHNWSDQPPPRGMFPPEDGRTRVQVLADFCQAGGMNYMNNIDETLGGKPEAVTADYAAFMDRVGEHYEKIARQLALRPTWAVAYDLINEAFHHRHEQYNPAIRRLIQRVRAIDRRHLCYVEPCESWGAIQQLALIEPTGDPLTVHSFHDYNFRLLKAEDRWPTPERDITSIYEMWLPVFVFAVRHGTAMHCGEFGGFARATNDSRAQTLLMNDFFKVFDQFGMHHHYYSGREVFESPITGRADGSLRPSNVVRAYRAYFSRGDFNAYYRKWPGHPEPLKAAGP